MKPTCHLKFTARIEYLPDVMAPVKRKYLQQWWVDDGRGGPTIKPEQGPEGLGWWQDVVEEA